MCLSVVRASHAARSLKGGCSICDELFIRGFLYIESLSAWSDCDPAFQATSAKLTVQGS